MNQDFGDFGVVDNRRHFINFLKEILHKKGFGFDEKWMASPQSSYRGPSPSTDYQNFIIKITWKATGD